MWKQFLLNVSEQYSCSFSKPNIRLLHYFLKASFRTVKVVLEKNAQQHDFRIEWELHNKSYIVTDQRLKNCSTYVLRFKEIDWKSVQIFWLSVASHRTIAEENFERFLKGWSTFQCLQISMLPLQWQNATKGFLLIVFVSVKSRVFYVTNKYKYHQAPSLLRSFGQENVRPLVSIKMRSTECGMNLLQSFRSCTAQRKFQCSVFRAGAATVTTIFLIKIVDNFTNAGNDM